MFKISGFNCFFVVCFVVAFFFTVFYTPLFSLTTTFNYKPIRQKLPMRDLKTTTSKYHMFFLFFVFKMQHLWFSKSITTLTQVVLLFVQVSPAQPTGGRRRRASEMDPDERRQRFLERNRAAASRCRQKRKLWVNSLEKKAEDLASMNVSLSVGVVHWTFVHAPWLLGFEGTSWWWFLCCMFFLGIRMK